ncbi:transcriptional regulator LysR family [Janthinobacterium sp. HH01]|uniref:LysR family transcriptional regulator n=1 Tax=Janthinobacterium sp. HH01 TaxID=1198452 RepID=UPI0002AEDB10|nr:LysR family transcriptional regulator [Janthinobacterium sp. HH01]ELX10667.1 transcriptional regulator LysR family [Janthinobacterium sp. HH01]
MDKARVISLFIGVVRAKSFSQAAVEAGLTPQAVSKAVRQLEEHLGVRLFHRTTRSLSLTEEGLRLFELSNPGLRLLDEALDQVRNSRLEADGLIHVAAPMSIGNAVIIPLLPEFQRRYPGAHFDLQLDDHFTDLVESKIDVGFRAGSPPERNLISRKLGDIVLLPCATPAYLALHGTPQTVSDLQQHRCTGFRRPNTGRMMPWELQVDGATVYQEVPAVASFNTVEGELVAVLSGVGIGQLPVFMIEAELASGALVPLLPHTASGNSGVFMYYQQRTQMPLRVRHFIDFVAERAPLRLAAQHGLLPAG